MAGARLLGGALAVLLVLGSAEAIDTAAEEAAAASSVFLETFTDSYEGRWVPSAEEGYNGVWKHADSKGHDDKGLLVAEKARKYGIAASLPKDSDPNEDTTVLQYEVRLQEGLDCGGAYLKFLAKQDEDWAPEKFKDSTDYSVMFGPDKCGSTNKVHFIFKHKNPVAGKLVEHHLKSPPYPSSDKHTHVYTAVIKPKEQKVVILVDGEEKKVADLKEDFEPPVQPPEEIDDPEDKKPEDWVDTAKIPDPEATKPDDWDEDAPAEVEDEDAEKPAGWLDDEPSEVDDPSAKKPEDWDEEEDGEWEAPKIPNPKCEEAPGCGEWKRPMKNNPAYKGKWSAPLIDNPAYKGPWAPRKIANPEYYKVETVRLEPISAVGIEIWTMSDGILFDNILISHDEDSAEAFRKASSAPKLEEETAEEKKELDEKKAATASGKEFPFNYLWHLTTIPILEPIVPQLSYLLDLAEAFQRTFYAVVGGIGLLLLTIFYSLLCARKPVDKAAKAKKEDVTEADDATEEVNEELKEAAAKAKKEVEEPIEEAEKTDEGATRRRTRAPRD